MNRLAALITANRWGGQALVCLFISVLSGLVLALQYNPATPFYSTATIELIVPYGRFWRSLHYYSSQAFFLLLLAHLAVEVGKNRTGLARWPWIRLCASLPVALLLLFTGYVLRGDATGEAAGAIAEHIALSIPLLGKPLNDLLFDVSAAGALKVYANHLIGLMVLGGICVWPHLRRYNTGFSRHLLLTGLVLLAATFLPTPMEPDRIGLTHIAGPWFFLGLQELLRYIPPFWAGVAIPGLLITALFALPDKGPRRFPLILFMIFWLTLYSGLTWISYGRM